MAAGPEPDDRPVVADAGRRLALLDLDGCLIDSTHAITAAIREGLSDVGVEVPATRSLTWCIGPPLADAFAHLLAEVGADRSLVPTCMDAYRAVYRRTWRARTGVVAGVPAALDELRAAGWRLAVVTSKPLPIAAPILHGLHLWSHVEALHAPAADHAAEPKTVTLARAMADLASGLEPGRAVMVGDREHDVVAGRACGTRTLGVTWGVGDRHELLTAGAERVVDEPSDLPAAMADLSPSRWAPR